MNKIIIGITVILVLFLFAFLGYYGDNLVAVFVGQEKIRVAACPTFHYMLEELSGEGMDTVKASSTSESIELIKKEEVDFFISGRPLKPDEPEFLHKVIGPGLSFIFAEEAVVAREDMPPIPFYTDLSAKKIREFFPELTDNLKEVEDVYQYLEKGIGITSRENTDYGRSSAVHVINKQGRRERFSRIPAIYFSDSSANVREIEKIIKEDIK